MATAKTKGKISKRAALLIAIIMVISLLPVTAMALTTNGLTLEFGNTSTPTQPESLMTFVSTGANTYHATYTGADASTFYPGMLTLYVSGTTAMSGTGVSFVTYDSSGAPTESSTATLVSDGYYTIAISSSASTRQIAITGTSGDTVITFDAPMSSAASAGANPSAVVGYLPVGQYANGTGWGAIGTSGNSLASAKFVGGYYATGVSLGAAGGYAEFSFNTPIYEDAGRSYGVDFVVYGNAFSGNPEAGSVKVFGYTSDTDTVGEWYELAGSLYYDATTIRNATVVFKKVTTPDGTFTSAGIWYKLNSGSWTKFNTNTAVTWWPESAEGYTSTWGSVDNVAWDQTANEITFSNVTLVKDTDTTNDYQFGYFDIHVNGSSYGAAINPYSAADTSTGGDGFDLAWAVNGSGEPVALYKATKVRVYTSAVMRADGTGVFITPSIFGETSAEVCGVYVATGTAGSAAAAPAITIDGVDLSDWTEDTVGNMQTVYVETGSPSAALRVTSPGSSIYLNSTSASSGTDVTITGIPTTGYKDVRVIVQNGTANPYILLIKLSQ